MLTAVKNQIKTFLLTIKYATMREMLNKATFITNIVFMILNNSTFIIQWIIIFSIKDTLGNYTFRDVILLWAIAAGTYGVAHFFFKKAFTLADIINSGKLDAFLVQPKNVLISVVSSDVEISAIGDMIYGIMLMLILRINIREFLLYVLFSINGGIMIACFAVILASFSFWFSRTDYLAETLVNSQNSFATYPESIFKSHAKMILFSIVPVGFINYIPIRALKLFNINFLIINIVATIVIASIAFLVFNRGLKKYSSTNLMISKI